MKEKIVLRCAAPSDILKALTRLENSSEAASSLLSSSPSSHSVRARTPAGTCPHSSNRPHRSPTPDCRATGGHTETPVVSVDRGEHLRKFAACKYSDKTTASVFKSQRGLVWFWQVHLQLLFEPYMETIDIILKTFFHLIPVQMWSLNIRCLLRDIWIKPWGRALFGAFVTVLFTKASLSVLKKSREFLMV